MIINYNDLEEQKLPEFKGGKGTYIARMFNDDLNKIMFGKLQPGSSIGMHMHDSNSELIYIISGNADVLYDDKTEKVTCGNCHYCPKGHSHSLINNSNEDLEFFAVVSNQ